MENTRTFVSELKRLPIKLHPPNKNRMDLASVNAYTKNTIIELLGIEFTKVETGYLEATMPVDTRTHQPYGILHGGASVVLAETLGSFGSHIAVDSEKFNSVGVEVNCNHIRSKREGIVTGKAKAVHLGRKIHVWAIDIVDEQEKLIATCRITVTIIPKT
jgi:1,4-dihydroxy-2-naphthoyl-CoA hydrolase